MLSPAAIARIKLAQGKKVEKNPEDTKEAHQKPAEEVPDFVLQGADANNLLLLQFASSKQYNLALSLFRKIQNAADKTQFDREISFFKISNVQLVLSPLWILTSVCTAETFALIFEVLAKKERSIDENEELAYIFEEMIERKYVSSINQVNRMISTCWKTRNLNGLTSVFNALTESLREYAPRIEAFPDVVLILDLAIETENPHCCAAIYGFILQNQIDISEDQDKMLARLWDANTKD